MKNSDNQNETIFLEILPELARKYENSNFANSLNIYVSELEFELIEEEKNFLPSDTVSIDISGIRCTAKFENCVAVKQRRINGEEEMMFGVFGIEGDFEASKSSILTSNTEISSLNARLILPRPSDQYVSQFELRDFEISKIENPGLFETFQSIFSCSIDSLKLRQRHKKEIFLHVNLEKEQKTPRSCVLEAIFEMLKFLGKIDESQGFRGFQVIKNIQLLCIPFVHFGKIRISAKIDENGVMDVKMFNLFGSLFGVVQGIGSQKTLIDSGVFLSENVLSIAKNPEDHEEGKKSKSSEENSSSKFSRILKNSIIPQLIEIIIENLKINVKNSSTILDYPLPYLGIDSLRIIELEYHIAKKWAELNLKSPFLKAHRTLNQVGEFLEERINEKLVMDNEKSMIAEEKTTKNHENAKTAIPLSSQQKRIRFVEEVSGKNESLASQFSEPIFLKFSKSETLKIQEILNFLTMRHSILRTSYHLDYQFLLSGTENFISIRKKEIDTGDQFEASEQSDFALKCILNPPGMEPNTLKLVFHHILIDGRSLAIFYKDFKNFFGNSMFKNAPRPLQYHDYCRKNFEAEKNFSAKNSNLDFWKSYLRNDMDMDFNFLPSDISSSKNTKTLLASTIFSSFPRKLQKKFDRFCLQNSLSRFELFFGLLELSINRIFGLSENFIIGFAVDEREFEFLDTMGCFTNVLPYLANSKKGKSMIKNLQKTAKTLRLLREKSMPYEKIVKTSGIDNFNFQIFAVSDVVEMDETMNDGLKNKKKSVRFENDEEEIQILQNKENGEKMAKYEMTWYLRQNLKDNSLQFEVEYASNLFNASTIHLAINEIFRLINGFSRKSPKRNPKKPIIKKSDFPLSTVSQMLQRSSDSRFKKSFQISRFLTKMLVKLHGEFSPEQPVMVKMPRTIELVEVMIATWKSGFYPVPMHLGSSQRVLDKVKEDLGGDKVILLERIDEKDLKFQNERRIFNHCTLYDMAYATCTSGSTGQPKLVATAFLGHSNLALQYTKTFQISQKDTVCQSVDPSFDIFFADVFKCLLNSARLLLAQDAIPSNSELLNSTVAYLMPAFLARIPDFKSLKNLKVLQFGGESLAPTVIQKILEENEDLKIYQEYGLTEQTVYSSANRIRGKISEIDKLKMRKIGTPYDNIGLEIQNSARRGQVFLRGIGLMRGYFGHSTIIRGKFGTGDEVYLDEKDEMVFVGRKDSQVKVRGFRIDLFEIECTALTSKLIDSCVCIVSKNQLVLFYKIINNGESYQNTEIQLKNHLEQELVTYKVPSRFIKVQSFPLTRTGKVDKKQLATLAENPEPESESPKPDESKTQRHSKNDSKNFKNLQEKFKNYLEHYSESQILSENVDIFSYGIDSISVMLTSQKLREDGFEIPVKAFFKEKTLRKILEAFQKSLEDSNRSENLSKPSKILSEVGEISELLSLAHFSIPLNHIQERILFMSRMTSPDFFRLEFPLSIENSMNFNDLKVATNTITMGNPLLRSIISREEKEIGDYQFLVLSGTEAYFSVDLGMEKNNISKKGDNPYETRIWISNSNAKSKSKNQLFLSVHHIICDGRSLQILKNQFLRFFERKIEFQRNFELQKIQKIEEIQDHIKIDDYTITFKSVFPNFKFGAKASKIVFDTPKNSKTDLKTHRIFYAFCKAIHEKFHLKDFQIACTFLNRTPNNWNTVSMFANTLPVKFHGKKDGFEDFSKRIEAINNASNVPLIQTGIGFSQGFSDFAMNFHKEIDISEGFCQFPVTLTYSENEEKAILEFDEKSIRKEEIENLKRRILKLLGGSNGFEIEKVVFSVFQKILKSSEITCSTDFFASGGHSLNAMKLIDTLSEELKIEIPIKLIFDNPTPKKLVEAIKKMQTGENDLEIDKKQESDSQNSVEMSFHFPLSPQQLQMFYLSELTSSSLEYQLPFIQPFQKSLDPQNIHLALLCTLQEQAIFRTIFKLNPETSEPYQEILSITECFIPCYIETVDSENELHQKIQDLCDQKIDVLEDLPLLKTAFLISPSTNVAFLHLHHLISDARSTQIMNSSMKEFIEGRSQRRLSYQYVDYCKEGVINQEIDKQYLEGLVKGATTPESEVLKSCKASTTIPLASLTAGFGTPFSNFLTLISPILTETFKVSTLNITFPVINRTEKTSGICGYFLNNLVINTSNLEDLPTVIHQNLPYSQVIREVRKQNNKNLMSAVYINCRYDLEFDESDDEVLLDLVPMKLHFPLEIDIDQVNEGYRVTMRSNQFEKKGLEKMLETLKESLDPKTMEKGGNGAEPRNQYFYGPRKDFPNRYSLSNLYHQFFKSSNYLTPNLTYKNTHSRIASKSLEISKQFLISRGSSIRSDDIIAVIGSKSIETTLNCLAVQFAGAGYLPIDKEYPEERKKEILKDAVFQVEVGTDCKSLKTRNFTLSTPESLAYVITTSGTTGKPKSVAISGLSVANLCVSSTVTMCVASNSRIFQFTNFVFDNSVLEIIMGIGNQEMLIYPEDKNHGTFDSLAFQKSINTPGISHSLLFPSLVQSLSISKISNLPYWIVGGERLPQNLLEDVLATGCHVIQNYGPTETTAFAVSKRMKFGDLGAQIGLPAVNTKLVIDKENGELLICGAGKMRGYLNRRMEDSFKRINNEYWYSSGDICKRMDNGDVEFVGRNDSQIKIRGYRVELSEIESTVETHCHVETCLAIFEQETQQIHVFYKSKSEFCGSEKKKEDIRTHCQKFLEGHKVPASFTKIEDFPLTGNSKIDKNKLMEMRKNFGNPSIMKPPKPVETSGNSILREIWSEILNINSKNANPHSISPTDDFFLMGGHSLLLIRLRHQILSKIGISLTVPELLENLKFGDLSKLIEQKKSEEKTQNFIFFPALYGGCAAYLKLCETLRKSEKSDKINVILLEEELGKTVEDVANKYKAQISRKITQPASLTFIGASAAGTFAFATLQKFLKIDKLHIKLVLLDSGTFWNLIDNLNYSNHVEEITENLKTYEIDRESCLEIAEKSWKTLQILKNFKAQKLDNLVEVLVLSVDGSDLGWSRFSENLKILKIPGDHYSMLQDPDHVAKIAEILIS